MSTPLVPAQAPIGFKRHVTAVLASNFVAATVFALYSGGVLAFETGKLALVLMISTVTWLGVFAIAAPASGFFFTIAFPLLRRLRARGLVISVMLGAAGGYLTMWSNHAAVAKHASVQELGAATLIGAIVGGAYWLMVDPPSTPAPVAEAPEESEPASEIEEAALQ